MENDSDLNFLKQTYKKLSQTSDKSLLLKIEILEKELKELSQHQEKNRRLLQKVIERHILEDIIKKFIIKLFTFLLIVVSFIANNIDYIKGVVRKWAE